MLIKDLKPAPTVKVVDRTVVEIDDLLDSYKLPPEPIAVPVLPPVQTPVVTAPTPSVVPPTVPGTPGMTSPGVPPVDVYKTGKKAGQPKPPRKIRATYTPSVEMAQIGSDILSGALFLTLVDLMIPVLIAGINNRFSKVKIKARELGMSEKQKKDLAPIADKVMSQINLQANPTLILILGMFGIYGMNLAALQMTKSLEQNDKNSKVSTEKPGGYGNRFDPTEYVQRAPVQRNSAQ